MFGVRWRNNEVRIAVGVDHGAFFVKQAVIEHIKSLGHTVTDFGTYDDTSCDYPDIVQELAPKVAAGTFDRGVLLCGTGIGMSVAANKVEGIRAALCHDTYSARLTRMHNDSNILCMGGRVIGLGPMLDIIETWLAGEFEGGRHQRRIDKVTGLEKA